MLSLTKLITLIGILAIVWFGFRLVGKLQRQRADALRRAGGKETSPKGNRTPPKASSAEDMVKCPTCGVYIPADAKKCGTPGCPQ